MQYNEDRAVDNRFESRIACKIKSRGNTNTPLGASNGQPFHSPVREGLPTTRELRPRHDLSGESTADHGWREQLKEIHATIGVGHDQETGLEGRRYFRETLETRICAPMADQLVPTHAENAPPESP